MDGLYIDERTAIGCPRSESELGRLFFFFHAVVGL